MWRRIRLILTAAIAVVALIGGYGLWQVRNNADRAGATTSGLVTNVSIGGPFALTDHTGRAVTDEDFRGRLMLVYFGYTFCPDVCPTELGEVALALDELGDDRDAVTPVLITIDPERDTAELLAEYVPLFHESMVGLTGSADAIQQVAQSYRVFYRKVEDPEYTYYLMDHTSFVYLMGRDGEFLSMFAYGTAPEEMAEAIRSQI